MAHAIYYSTSLDMSLNAYDLKIISTKGISVQKLIYLKAFTNRVASAEKIVKVRSFKLQIYLFQIVLAISLYFFQIYIVTSLSFSFKEAFQMPFTSISRKILCEDILPLFPLPSLPKPSSSMRIPTSVSYYEVLHIMNIFADSFYSS